MKTKPLPFRLTWQWVSPNFYFHYSSCVFHLSVHCGYWPICNLPRVWVWFVPVACLIYMCLNMPLSLCLSLTNDFCSVLFSTENMALRKGWGIQLTQANNTANTWSSYIHKLFPTFMVDICHIRLLLNLFGVFSKWYHHTHTILGQEHGGVLRLKLCISLSCKSCWLHEQSKA